MFFVKKKKETAINRLVVLLLEQANKYSHRVHTHSSSGGGKYPQYKVKDSSNKSSRV
jgi:hypothetical protein